MKVNKKKKLIILNIICAIILLYFVFFKGIYASSNKIIGPYSKTELYKEFISYENWKIGENLYGEPIFCYEDNAFQFTKQKYFDILNRVYEMYHKEYHFEKMNKHNYKIYRDLLSELSLNGEDDNRRLSLIKLLDLYENGQKRWKYEIGSGWDRK